MGILERLAAVRKPEEKLKEGLLEAYAAIAKEEGFGIAEGKEVALFLSRGEEEFAVEIQFGSRQEIRESLRRLVLSGAQMCVLVTSSLIRSARFGELPRMLDEFGVGKRRFAFVDVENGKILRVNFEQQEERKGAAHPLPQQAQERGGEYPAQHHEQRQEGRRRKMIYGRKGEHKEQD